MKTRGRLLAIGAALVAVMLAPGVALADTEPDVDGQRATYEAVEEILPASYRQVDLSVDGVLAIPDTSGLQANIPQDTYLPGIELSATAAQFNNVRIPINQQFTFTDEWPVGYACLDALVQAGSEAAATAKLYLDDGDEPLATYALKTDTSTTKWNSMGSLTQSVLGKIASGTHSVSLGFEVSGVADDATVTVEMRTVEFMYSSLPVMQFDLAKTTDDLTEEQRANNYGTITDMNSSEDHSVRTRA